MFRFYTPWKRPKTFGFLTFLGGIEMENWAKMGWNGSYNIHTCNKLQRDSLKMLQNRNYFWYFSNWGLAISVFADSLNASYDVGFKNLRITNFKCEWQKQKVTDIARISDRSSSWILLWNFLKKKIVFSFFGIFFREQNVPNLSHL